MELATLALLFNALPSALLPNPCAGTCSATFGPAWEGGSGGQGSALDAQDTPVVGGGDVQGIVNSMVRASPVSRLVASVGHYARARVWGMRGG